MKANTFAILDAQGREISHRHWPADGLDVVQPLRDNVFVELEPTPSDYIIYPDAYMDAPVIGKVLAVGPGRRTKKGVLLAPGVQVGDRIRFYFGGVAAHYPDKRHAIIEHEFIQSIIET